MRIVRLLACGLLVACLVLAVVSWTALPDTYPTRVNGAGVATSLRERSLEWFLLPAMNLLTFALLQGIALMLPRRPTWFNFPERDRFLALPEHHRGPVIAEMQLFMQATALGIVMTFGIIQVGIWRTAMGSPPGAFAILPYFAFLLTPFLLVLVSRVSAATERAEKRWREVDGGESHTGEASRRTGTGFTRS